MVGIWLFCAIVDNVPLVASCMGMYDVVAAGGGGGSMLIIGFLSGILTYWLQTII